MDFSNSGKNKMYKHYSKFAFSGLGLIIFAAILMAFDVIQYHFVAPIGIIGGALLLGVNIKVVFDEEKQEEKEI